MEVLELQKMFYRNAADHGFWDDAKTEDIPTKLMLIVSELAEALEHYREGTNLVTIQYKADKPDKPDGFAVELADALIRVLDLAEWLGIDLEAVALVKHAYNVKRPFKHGKSI